MHEIVDRWNRDYFGGELSPACLDEISQIDRHDRELVDFVDTFLFYSHLAGRGAKDVSPLSCRFMAKIAKSYMPSLWAKIPPITRGGRLQVIDRVIRDVIGILPDHSVQFLDVGCGYPPLPTIETAEMCPNWTCVGIDPNFPESILFDDEGTGACFDEAGRLIYIQYLNEDLQPELKRVKRDQQKFVLEWNRVQNNPLLKEESIRGARLIDSPIKHYERHNLSFQSSNLASLGAHQVFDLIRCINVFNYFSGQTILDNIRHAKSLLADSGVFICGSVPERGSAAARYLVYKKCSTAFVPLLFGMDLGKFSQRDENGWWAFHKDQPDVLFLAKILQWVHEDHDLFSRVSGTIDRMEHDLGYSYRDADGYLHQNNFIFNTSDNARLNITVAEECGDKVSSFLGNMGICSRVTPLGHLVIDLPQTHPEKYAQYFPVL